MSSPECSGSVGRSLPPPSAAEGAGPCDAAAGSGCRGGTPTCHPCAASLVLTSRLPGHTLCLIIDLEVAARCITTVGTRPRQSNPETSGRWACSQRDQGRGKRRTSMALPNPRAETRRRSSSSQSGGEFSKWVRQLRGERNRWLAADSICTPGMAVCRTERARPSMLRFNELKQ